MVLFIAESGDLDGAYAIRARRDRGSRRIVIEALDLDIALRRVGVRTRRSRTSTKNRPN